jgi:hypothetical protein
MPRKPDPSGLLVVIGAVLSLLGFTFAAPFALVYFAYRDYEPIYYPRGLPTPAERADEFFLLACACLAAVALGGVLLAFGGRRR